MGLESSCAGLLTFSDDSVGLFTGKENIRIKMVMVYVNVTYKQQRNTDLYYCLCAYRFPEGGGGYSRFQVTRRC